MDTEKNRSDTEPFYAVTAGSHYLDIDAYACSVALAELLILQGKNATAYSDAPYNYSVCDSLVEEGQMKKSLPLSVSEDSVRYIIVDVSDPLYLSHNVPLDRVVAVYDHHTGYEEYWRSRIGDNSHIEFIGAAATLIFSQWKSSGMLGMMKRPTALLLIAAILDNTLDLTSSNTTAADVEAYDELCGIAGFTEDMRAGYFSEVQRSVERDLKNALFNDIKNMRGHPVLPPRFAQLCVWDARRIIDKLDDIRRWFNEADGAWMLNIIDINRRVSFFVCEDPERRDKLGEIFGISFTDGIAETGRSYLRKEIIKTVDSYLYKK